MQNFGGMFVVMTCKTYRTPSFVTLVVNFGGFKFNPRIVWCSSGISICPPLPRSQISPSMPALVLFIISMLAKSKVHQISRADGVWVVISLISKYGCLLGVKEVKIYKKTCKKAWKIVSHNTL